MRAEMGYDAGVSSVSGVAVNMDNEEIPLTFTAVEPGVYEASSAKLTEGSYQVQLELEQTDGTKEYVRGGVYFSYSPEYDVTNVDGCRQRSGTAKRALALAFDVGAVVVFGGYCVSAVCRFGIVVGTATG